MKWTQLEKDKLMAFIWDSDCSTNKSRIEEARERLYFAGEYPELKPKSFSACLSMFYKEIKNNQI